MASAAWLLSAGIAAAAWLATTAAWFLGVRRMAELRRWRRPLGTAPLVSAVVPARDEERWLGAALSSLLAQDYPAFEVIAVDDRSTDRTPQILANLAAHHPNLRLLRVERLPDGWLGKNHALWLGAREARGEWLLFADADVRFRPSCLRQAVAFARARRLDHLTLFPEFRAEGVAYRSFVLAFLLFFCLYSRPWRARNPAARDAIGVGAFNLVRRSAYEAAGTHRTIAHRPDDDLQLGRLLKGRGFRQEAAFGTGLLAIEWYPGLGAAIRGLEKNALVPFRFRLGQTLLACALAFVANVLPAAGFVLTDGWPALLFAVAVGLQLVVCGDEARGSGLPWGYAALHPVGAALVVYAILRAGVLAVRRGGIRWRGTDYPLDLLRRP